MKFLGLFSRASQQDRLAKLVAEVASRSCAELWSLVQSPTTQMSPAQARGYLRARSAPLVAREAEAALRCRGSFSNSLQAELIELAKEQVVVSLLGELQRIQKVARFQQRAA